MQRVAKKVVMWVIGILVVFSILVGTLPDIIVASGNLTTDVAGLPDIIGTVASFWWVGVLLLLIGVVMNTNLGKRTFRRFSRRRR